MNCCIGRRNTNTKAVITAKDVASPTMLMPRIRSHIGRQILLTAYAPTIRQSTSAVTKYVFSRIPSQRYSEGIMSFANMSSMTLTDGARNGIHDSIAIGSVIAQPPH
jgi:hypothetical protein